MSGKTIQFFSISLILVLLLVCNCVKDDKSPGFGLPEANAGEENNNKKADLIDLPEPKKKINTTLEETLSKRRSIRSYKNEAVTLADVSQILWAKITIGKNTTKLTAKILNIFFFITIPFLHSFFILKFANSHIFPFKYITSFQLVLFLKSI